MLQHVQLYCKFKVEDFITIQTGGVGSTVGTYYKYIVHGIAYRSAQRVPSHSHSYPQVFHYYDICHVTAGDTYIWKNTWYGTQQNDTRMLLLCCDAVKL